MFISEDKDLVKLKIKLWPNSAKNSIEGVALDDLFGEYLKIKVRAAPKDNEANEALIAYLAEVLGVPKSKIQLLKGHTMRVKTIGVSAHIEDVRRALRPYVGLFI